MTPKAKIAAAILVTVLGIVASKTYAGIWVDPNSFDVNTPEGTVLEETLTIGNDGIEDLDFMIRTRQSGASGRGNYGISTSGQSMAFSIPAQHDFTTIAGNASYQPGRLIVRFAQSSSGQLYTLERKNQILSSLGGASIEKEFRIVPGLSVVQLPAGVTVEEALPVFNNTDGILYAEPDYEVTVCSTIPDDLRFNELWGMHNTGQSGGTVDADIDAPEAWDISTGSSDIIVAVIDTGADYTHPDLAANMWVNEGEIPGNGLDDDGNGYIDDVYGYDFCNNDGDPWDDHYHGTHCAGTIGAVGNNNQGVAGVCWNVRIMAVKFLNSAGSGSTSDAIASVQYSVLMGAHLSSNSWGGGSYSQGLKDAIDAAGAAGMLFVAAAGNDNTNNDSNPHYPSSYDCESLISVMATDRNDNKSSFSNYGPTSVDLGAPGSSILSCKPGNQYQYLNGTSMATPHVAGACALLWSMNSAISNLEIKNILLQTVDSTLPGLCVSQGRLNLYSAILETEAPWITIEPQEGTVGPGDSNDLSVTFDALEMSPGTYEAEIIIISNDPCSPTIVPVTMTVNPDDLVVLPDADFESSGTRSGPFTPTCMTYTLTNNGIAPVSWTTDETENWVEVDPNKGVLNPNNSLDVNVCITSYANLLDPNIYEELLIFENTDSNSIKLRLVTLTVKPPDCFTEFFDGNDSDLEGLMLTFSPDGSGAYYEACRKEVDAFPTDPNGGTYVPLGDDDFAEVILSNDANILFYGTRYDRFYIGSNGYITFEQGDTEFSASLEKHFNMPRISALFTDLTPADSQNISYKQLEDRVAITFKDVPLYGDKMAKNSFQVEMFYIDGTIRITWLDLAPAACIAGLSEGYGLPLFFLESDLSKYVPCRPYGDFNKDYSVDMFDLAIFVSHWLEADCGIPYWCEKTDLNFSNAVEMADFAIFASNWLAVEDWWLQPVSHWKFDEGSGTIAYDSAGDNDGTLVNGPIWTTGQIDGALDFDTGDYVDCGSFAELDGATAFSMSFWIKADSLPFPSGIPGYLGVIRHGTSSQRTPWIYGEASNSYLSIQFETTTGGVGDGVSNTSNLTQGQWHHIVWTWDGTTVTPYKNGVPGTTDTTVGSVLATADSNLEIGRIPSPYSSWDGSIDDVRIYDRALSAEEIWQLYREGLGPKAVNPNPPDRATGVDPNVVLSWSPGKDALSHDVYLGIDFDDVNNATPDSNEYMGNYDVNTFDPCGLDFETTYYWRIDELDGSNTYKGDVWRFTTWIAPNLVSYWKFDEGSGTTAYDSAGNNDGTIYGATWTTGQIDGALSFDGVNDYVDIGDPADGSLDFGASDSFTISIWFKRNVIDVDHTLISKREVISGAHNEGYSWRIYNNNLYAGIEGTNTVGTPITGSTAIGASQWYHAVFVRDVATDKLYLYLNGVSDATPVTDPTTTTLANTYNFMIGRWEYYNLYFDGVIDDVRVYDRALSADEVWQLYQQGLE
jgi:subtilisin family serine protease